MANQNLSQFGEKLFVADADHTFIWDSEASISKRVSRNSWLNSGTLTSDAPVTISQTWGTTGIYTAAKVNVTETATANSASRLLDLQVGGASLANFSKAGHLIFPSSSTVTPSGPGVGQWVGTLALFGTGGSLLVTGSGGSLNISGNILLSWNNDTVLLRDGAANTLALRNGAAAQTFNVYGTSSASNANYARLALTCGLDGNATISTQALGTGTAGVLAFSPSNTERMRITTAGNVGIGTTDPGSALTIAGALGTNTTTYDSAAALKLTNTTGNSSWLLTSGVIGIINASFCIRRESVALPALTIAAITDNVGIGTTSPTSKLHVAGSSSPSITVDNTLATGASQLLFRNTVVTGDTDGIFLNGSTQTGFGGAGSLNIKATSGPIAFHTNTVTNALSIAQNGVATFSQAATFVNDINGQRDVYCASNRYLRIGSSMGISSHASGVLTFAALNPPDGIARLTFGGIDATFPALKRSGTSASFDVVLANDSGFTSIQDLYRRFGAGTPEGVVTAPIGAVYHNTTGGAGTSFYVKESGTGNTGWVGK